jgi:hypothetical protein
LTPIAERLPDDPERRRVRLDAYFPRRLADAEQMNDGRWSIEVRPFDREEMHVDPALRAGLDWWQYGLDVRDIAIAVRRSGASQLSLEDSWTAFSWSKWLVEARADRMAVLHVDDHDDLMAPLLARRPDRRWDDLLTGRQVDLRRPCSVYDAVASGAIGVAGFFTPFIHEFPTGEVRHLCASGYSRTRTGWFRLMADMQHDDLLRLDAERPAVRLAQEIADDSASGWRYNATADPEGWLADLPSGPLLLHIDFDYFCNRFNGDSDWRCGCAPNDASREEVLTRVDAMVTAIGNARIGHRIVDVCGALSPGFFPSELWPETVSQLAAGLSDAGVDVDAWHV